MLVAAAVLVASFLGDADFAQSYHPARHDHRAVRRRFGDRYHRPHLADDMGKRWNQQVIENRPGLADPLPWPRARLTVTR
jgi:hypothetical protein